MTVPSRWALLTIGFTPALSQVQAVATTDVACHLWARWTENEPQFHPLTMVIRGQTVPWSLRTCFTAYQDLEQDEAGDTLSHTFTWNPWIYCITRWFYCYGTIGGLKSPSTSGIFKYHNQFVPPPPEEEITMQSFTPWSLGGTKTTQRLWMIGSLKSIT
jgi:hypothetical protein